MKTDVTEPIEGSLAINAEGVWDIHVPRTRLFIIPALLLLGAIFTVVAGMLLGGFYFRWSSLTSVLIFVPCLFLVLIPFIIFVRRRTHLPKDWTAPTEDRVLESSLASICENSDRIASPFSLHKWEGVARAIQKRGTATPPLRLWWRSPPPRIKPLEVHFEPRPLNEADRTFRELAVHSEGAAPSVDNQVTRVDGVEPTTVQVVRRNVRMQGGWLFVIPTVAFFLEQVAKSIQKGSPTFMLFFFGLLLALLIFHPKSGERFERQLLLVPSGLILRWNRKGGTGWDLHLFSSRTATLLVVEKQKGTWVLALADENRQTSAIVTELEANMLLRAWLSPLSPPPVERMGDFV